MSTFPTPKLLGHNSRNASDQIFDIIVNQATEAIFVFDQSYNCSYTNEAAIQLLKLPANQIINSTLAQLFSPNFYQRLILAFEKVGNSGKELHFDWSSAHENLDIQCLLSPIFPKQTYAGGFVLRLRDHKPQQEAEATIRQLAYFDALTGLPNRSNLEEELQRQLQSLEKRAKLAIIALDLDRFKKINETHSHAVGDQVLVAMAKRLLATALPSGGYLGRLSGDEFMFILPNVTSPPLARWCRDLLNHVQEIIPIGSQELSLTASIGGAMYPQSGKDASTLMKNADIALYEAKSRGRSCIRMHTERLGARAMHQLALENALHLAVEHQQFIVHYQPIIECRTGHISKAEALIRWQHPQLGMIGPADFIQLSEQSEDIFKIGTWMIEAVTSQLRQWRDAGLTTPKIAINLSPRQLNQFNLVEILRQAVDKKGLELTCLEVEVTESTAIQDIDQAIRRLLELRQIGIHTAIDDFGSGYASLSYLKRLPINTIKVDKLFIHDCTTNPQDAAIVKSIIDLAHGLKLRVIAEGIEDNAQVAFLLSLGCDFLQGFLFSRPLPADQFAELLRQEPTYMMEGTHAKSN